MKKYIKFTSKILFILTLTVFIVQKIYAQTGPGGVGNPTTNKLWLRADDIQGLNDGENIQVWPDTSGNNNDAEQLIVANQPAFDSISINNLPSLRFDGDNSPNTDCFLDIFSIPGQYMTIITIFAHDHTGNSLPTGPIWETDPNAIYTSFIPMHKSGRQYLAVGSSSWLYKTSTFNRNTWYNALIRYGNNNSQIWQDGLLNQETGINTVDYETFGIGTRSKYADWGFRGNISEIIFYDYDLNDAERIIVENYLAAKYKLTTANDYYVYQAVYGNEVAGIGREDASNQHTESQSAKVLTISNPSDLDDGEYLFFGHNDSTNTWTTNGAPNSGLYTKRLKKDWRVNRTGNIGTVTVKLDTTFLEDKADYTEYILWIDNDIDGDQDISTGDVEEYVLSKVGLQYQAENITISDGAYITFGIRSPIQFTLSSSEGPESSTPVNLEVSIETIFGSNVSVDYAVNSGSASGGGTDYTLLGTGTATITSGSLTTNIQLDIIDDNNIEADETIVVTLSNPVGLPLGENTTHTYTIIDNDYGSTGPAGIGSSSSNQLWLKADNISKLNGETVDVWPDASGNNNDANQTIASNRAIFNTNVINSLPAVSFGGNDFYSDIFTTDNINISVFAVFAHNHDGSAQPAGPIWQSSTNLSGSSVFLPMYQDGSHQLRNGSGSFLFNGTSSFTQSSWYIAEGIHSTNSLQLWSNGSVLNNENFENKLATGQFRVGNASSTYGDYEGYLAELIYFNFDVNSAQRIILENYLAAKYNLTIANDYYAYEASHSNDVAGIGRVDAANLHAIAQSAKILEIGYADDLSDGEYVIFGHDNGDITTWTSTEAPVGNRLAREWRVDETGDVGTVTIRLDTATLPLNPTGYDDFVVWVDNDGDFTSGAAQYPLKIVDGDYIALTVEIADGDFIAFGSIRSLNFVLTENNGSEDSSPVNIEVEMSAALGVAATVDYAVTGGTAISPDDYTLLGSGTLTITAGETLDTIQVTITDDPDKELEETIIITLSNSTNITLGADTIFTFTINDNDFEGYVGPAGIGDNTTNPLWLKASLIDGLSDNDFVSEWADTSGNDHDATSINDYRPIYKTNILNGQPVVRLDGEDDYFDNNYTYDARSVFVVYNVADAMDPDELGQVWGNYAEAVHVAMDARSGGNVQGWSFDGNSNTNARYAINGNNFSGFVRNDNSSQWIYNQFEISSVEFQSTQSLTRQVIGSLVPSFTVGEHQFGGDIAEIIVYNTSLNDAQRIIVENYLSAQYAISLVQNDKYAYQSNHFYDLAGIGKVDDSNYHSAAQSAKILMVSNASSLEDGDYLLFAHDGADAASWTTTETPNFGTNVRRIAREWRFDETGDLGTTTITIDTTLFASRPAEYSNFVIWIDEDGDFSSNAVAYPLTQIGSTAEFSGENVDIPDGYYFTIGCIRPVIQFTYATQAVSEVDGIVDIEISLNFPVANDVTVNYSDAGTGSAINGGDDYNNITSSIATISQGNTTTNIQVTIVDDVTAELDEDIDIGLNTPTGATLGTNSSHELVIQDNDWTREIQFQVIDSTINEDAGTIDIIVEISQVDAVSATTVAYNISGTATGGGSDYTLVNGTFTIPANEITDTVQVSITDDGLNEDTETIILTLSNPTNSSIGANDEYTITITDDDAVPIIQFTTGIGSGAETITPVNIEVSISDFSGKDISVDYIVSDISAMNGVDYDLADGTLTILSGGFTNNIVATILKNLDVEFDETFKVTLSNPINATLGITQEFIYTITDDDSPRFIGPGGVGNAETNNLWLKADSITGLSDNDLITEWLDVSGNNRHATQSSAGNQPTYQTSEVNGFPVVQFDGGTTQATGDLFADDYTYRAQNMFIVFRESSALQNTGDLAQLWGNYEDGTHIACENRGQSYQYGYSFDGDQSSGTTARYGHNGENFGPFDIDTDNPSDWTYDNFYLVTVEFNDNQTINRQIIGSLYPRFNIGEHQFGGDIAEIIVYEEVMNDAQRIIIDNYLSSKYNIALTQNDIYTHDIAGGGVHYFDVAGIGKIDNNNFHVAAQSASTLKLGFADDLDGGEYLMFGHDNRDYTTWTSTEIPTENPSLQRIAREWRIDETGNVGTITLTVDTAVLPNTPSGFINYVALVDADGDFTNGATQYNLTVNDTVFEIENVDLNDGDYITIAIRPVLVNYATTTLSGMESFSPIDIIVELSDTSGIDVNVDYTITGGSAAGAGTDYTLANGTYTILAGNLTDTVQIVINNDGTEEPNEDIEITLSNPVNTLLGEDTVITYTIIDDDGFGYFGPGGIGNFTQQIATWLETTQQDALADGMDIGTQGSATEWIDLSGNDINAYDPGLANPPTYWDVSPTWNGKPVIRFEQANQHYLEIANNSRMNIASGPQTERTIIAAFRTGTDISSRQVIFEEGGGARGLNIYIEDDTLFIGGWNNANDADPSTPWYYASVKAGLELNTPYFAILQFDFDGQGGNDGVRGSLNGLDLGLLPGAGLLYPHAGAIGIGGINGNACFDDRDGIIGDPGDCGGGNFYFEGFIAEIISGNMIYNDAQLLIVHNYLAAKYGTSLPAGDTLYNYGSVHGYEVIGIGQEDASNTHNISQGSGAIKIDSPSDIADGRYLLMGHNNDSINNWVSNEAPNNDPNILRIRREWRADKSGGDIGSITLRIDTLDFDALPVGYSTYALIVDSDGDFTTNAEVYQLSDDGDGYYSASNVDFTDGYYFTIGVINPAIDFVLLTSNNNEADTTVYFEIGLNFISQTDVTVDYATSNGTADDSQAPIADYTAVSGTFTMTAGLTSDSISVDILNDLKIENDETFTITLSNPSLGISIGNDTVHTYTIHDDDNTRKVEFDLASSSGNEGTTPAAIEVVLTENNPSNPVTVVYNVLTISTASNGSDYNYIDSDTLTFPVNDMTEFLSIPIVDDIFDEADETIILELTSPTNANLGTNTLFTYTILDNDTLPDVYFQYDTLSGKESITPVNLEVQLSSPSGSDVLVDYSIEGGTASGAGSDYTLSNGTLTIPAGEDSANIVLSVFNDAIEESNEYLRVSISNPVNAEIVDNDTITYIIIDDDGLGYVGPGGIGNFTDQIDVWLRTSETPGLTNGELIGDIGTDNRWKDQTGNNIDAYQDVSANAPTFWSLSPNWNGYPVIEFDRDQSQFLEIEDNSRLNTPSGAQTKRTIIAAFRPAADVTNRQVIYEEGGGARGLNIYIEDDTLFIGGWNNADDDATTPWYYSSVKTEIEANKPYFAILQFDFDGSTGEVRGSLNGVDLGVLPGAGKLFPHGGDIGIGGDDGGACFDDRDGVTGDPGDCGSGSYYFDGFIAELISGNIVFNDAQLLIVHNYLAAKYNIELPLGDDLYDYQNGYSSEIIGIGQEDADNAHVESQGPGIIKINNPSGLGNGRYLLIGHNNDSIETWHSTGVPNGDPNINRVDRVWRVDKQGDDIGTIDVYVDTAEFADLPAGLTDYVIMIDSDGDFTTGASVIQMNYDADGYFIASGMDFTKGDYFTVACIRPSIDFVLSESEGDETIDEFQIEIELNFEAPNDITVDYQSSDITAQVGQTPIADYNELFGTFTLTKGSTSGFLTLTVNNDAEGESDEQLLITLSNPSAGVSIGEDTTHIFTIHDDDQSRKVEFVEFDGGVSHLEDAGTVDIVLSISENNPANPVYVDYEVLGSSTAEADSIDYYLLQTGTLTFPVNTLTDTLSINIIDDASDEFDETIVIQLSNPQNANLGFNQTFTDTIIDNDAGPEIYFVVDTLSGMESVSPVEINVKLTSVSGRDITVDYSASDITAQGLGLDYTLNDGTLSFPAGTDSVILSADIFNDGVEEANEDFLITLTNPTNAMLQAGNDELVYKILDDDGLGWVGPGGVGDFDNQIDAWLRTTDVISLSDGINVSTGNYAWVDKTGNGLDAYQTVLSQQPTYWDISPTWNNRPVIVFDQAGSEFLEISDNNRMNIPPGPQNQRTIIVAFRPANNINDRQVVYEEGGGWRGLTIYVMNDSLYIGGWNHPDDQGASDPSTPWDNTGDGQGDYIYVSKKINTNTPYFAMLQFDFDEFGTGTVEGYLNGEYLGVLQGAGRLYPHPGDIGIGAMNNGSCFHDTPYGSCPGGENYYFDGYISEFITGNIVYNEAQLKLVNNYLAAKYNVTLPVSEDKYDYHVDHGYEVFGIGQVTNVKSHFVAKGHGVIKIDNPTNTGDNKFLLIGHEGSDIEDWHDFNEIDVPNNDPNLERLYREWRVDKYGGDIGDIDVAVAVDSLPTMSFGYSKYVLMVDTNDGDFTDCTIMYEMANDGDGYYKASGVSFSKGDYFTIGTANPTIKFTTNASSGFEPTTNVDIEVSLNYIPATDYEVDYTTIDGSANAGSDYTNTSGTLTLPAKYQTGNITIQITNDTDTESDETVLIELSNPSIGLSIGEDTTHTYTIHDDDNSRKIQFTSQEISYLEDITSYNIEVHLNERDAFNETKAYYQVTGGTATDSGTDFTLSSDTVRIAAGDSLAYITLNVNNDLLNELDETIIVTLSAPGNANLGDTVQFTYTILDNDAEPTVQFFTTTGSGAESYSPAFLEVRLSSVSGRDIDVDYTTNDITAFGGGIDYAMTNGETRTFTIAAGTDSANISLDIVNDIVLETTKSLQIDLSNPRNASLGTNTTFTYSIIDDDGLGFVGPGGVGSDNQYKVWYNASAESFNNGDPINTLTDQSGNGNDATAGNAPTYTTNVVNGRPAITFDGSTDYLIVADSEDINIASGAQTQRNLIAAFQTGANVSTRQVIWEEGGTGRGLNIYIDGGSLYVGAWNLAEDYWGFTSFNTPITANSEYYVMLEMIGDTTFTSDSLIRGYVNGSLIGTSTDAGPLYPHGGDIRLGTNEDAVYHDGNSSVDHFFNGELFEFISYNYYVNSAQKKLIENYYAAKLRNQIETDIQNDLYDYRVGYGYEVFGIGQDDSDNNHVVSRGPGIVRIDQPTDMSDGDYMLIGHDNGTIDAWTTVNVPLDSVYRVSRVWAVDTTGSPGRVRISVDTTRFASKPANYETYVLIVDHDGDFTSGDEDIYPILTSTGVYRFIENVNFNKGDLFTVGVARNRTIASGDWNDPSIWLTGRVPLDDETALVTGGDTIAVNIETEIGQVTVGIDAQVNLNNSETFILNEGSITLLGTAEFNTNTGTVKYARNGNQTIADIQYYDLFISGSGTKSLENNIDVDRNIRLEQVIPTLTLDVTMNNYNINVAGNWNSNGAVFEPQQGTVIFDGAGNQVIDRNNIGDETFYNLILQTSGELRLRDNVNIGNTLTMNGGNIDADNITNDTLNIGISATNRGTLIRNSGYILGSLGKWFTTGASIYSFPIGTSSSLRPIDIDFSTISNGGRLVSRFVETDPGLNGLPVNESAVLIQNTFTEGYWSLSGHDSFAFTGNYNVDVNADGFTSFDIGVGTRLLTRTSSGANWILNGTHVDVAGNIISRNAVTVLNAQFAVADTTGCSPNTLAVAGTTVVCANETGVTYTVENHAGSTYTWNITGGTQVSGGNTNSITVNWGAVAGAGIVKVVEDNGCDLDSVEWAITINDVPADPGVISGNNPIDAGTTHTYSITPISDATTYTWSLPADLTGTSDADTIGITFDPLADGDYIITVVGTNACGNSIVPSTLMITVNAVPEKPTTPVGTTPVCQDAPNTDYSTTATLRAVTYEWEISGGGTSKITGTTITSTVDWDPTFSGTVDIRVRGLNSSGTPGEWSDYLTVTVNPQPNATLTINALLDSICTGNNTELEIDFIAGTAPFNFTIQRDKEIPVTTITEDVTGISSDPYIYTPAVLPVWVNDGSPETEYFYSISIITDANGCSNSGIGNEKVTIFKIPETGPQYHIINDWGY